MKKQLLVVIAALALIAVLMPAAASAQMPNMDMSWAIPLSNAVTAPGRPQRPQGCHAVLQLHAAPSPPGLHRPLPLPTGVTPQSMAASNARLQQSYNAYNNAAQHNSDVTHNAVNNWDYQAVRGCWWSTNAYGQRVMVCP